MDNINRTRLYFEAIQEAINKEIFASMTSEEAIEKAKEIIARISPPGFTVAEAKINNRGRLEVAMNFPEGQADTFVSIFHYFDPPEYDAFLEKSKSFEINEAGKPGLLKQVQDAVPDRLIVLDASTTIPTAEIFPPNCPECLILELKFLVQETTDNFIPIYLIIGRKDDGWRPTRFKDDNTDKTGSV